MPGGGRRWKTLVSLLREFRLDIEFPTVAHRPWKSPKARFPHFHSADDVPGFFYRFRQLAPAGLAWPIATHEKSEGALLRRAERPGVRKKEESLLPGKLD